MEPRLFGHISPSPPEFLTGCSSNASWVDQITDIKVLGEPSANPEFIPYQYLLGPGLFDAPMLAWQVLG